MSNSISRYASPSLEFGPLSYLDDSWTGDSGWNLMVVPKVVDGKTSFLVMVQKLYETHNFNKVGGPVPNRGGAEGGKETLLAVKYNQTVAEKASKNILHEEVGMWLYQTPSGTSNSGYSTNTQKFDHPILRQGIIPHGNSILLAGGFDDANPAVPVFPSASTAYLPKILTQGVDKKVEAAFMQDYLDQVKRAFDLLPPHETENLTFRNFINPTELLTFARKQSSNDGMSDLQFDQVINLHVNAANATGYGGLQSIPFAHDFADPVDFEDYFSIQVVKNQNYSDATADTQDEVPDYFQIQYFQNIKIKFKVEFMGEKFDVEFPHYQLNTLIKI